MFFDQNIYRDIKGLIFKYITLHELKIERLLKNNLIQLLPEDYSFVECVTFLKDKKNDHYEFKLYRVDYNNTTQYVVINRTIYKYSDSITLIIICEFLCNYFKKKCNISIKSLGDARDNYLFFYQN